MGGRAIQVFLLLSLLGVVGCADSKEVNAAFSRTRVSWALFDASQPNGLRDLPGFEQPVRVSWLPRPQGVMATDLLPLPGGQGAVAVSRLGLLILEDSTGSLTSLRPEAQWPFEPYQTGRLFAWKGRVFLTLGQSAPFEAPPASLAWWLPGETRLAFYPIPSQVRDPQRQAVQVEPPRGDSTRISLVWKLPLTSGPGWRFEGSQLDLDTGVEVAAPPPMAPPRTPDGSDDWQLRRRLTDRLGEVPVQKARGPGHPLMFTDTGWVAVGEGEGQPPRLYRLPDLGSTGRYVGALALLRGYVFTWETAFRGYVGAAGVVYVPFAVLAP